MKFPYTNAILLLLVAVLFQACGKKETPSSQSDSEVIPVRIVALEKTAVESVVQLSGQLTTDDETNLSFKTGGVIKSILVKEGDAIHKGELLATLDLTEVNTQVAQSKSNFEKAERDFARISRLYKDSVATLEQFQNSQTTLTIAREQFTSASFNQNFSAIRALGNGVVLKKFVSEGQVITSGTPVLQTNGAASGKWILRCGASDRDWAALGINDHATITFDVTPAVIYHGVVSRKSGGADPSTGSFSVEISLDSGKPGNFAAAMFGKASVSPRKKNGLWTIPYDALLDGDEGQGFVFVTNDLKTALKTRVEISSITKNNIQITSGLENSKALIISGNAYLTDSSAIRVIR